MIDKNESRQRSGPPAPVSRHPQTPSLTPDELAQLADAAKQEDFRREYLAQLRRRACPGCGETDDPLI